MKNEIIWALLRINFVRECAQAAQCLCNFLSGKYIIQHAFSKPSLVNLISKDANLVFYLSAYQETSEYDVMIYFYVDSVSLQNIQRHHDLIMAHAVR